MLWQLRADHEQKQELGGATITRGLDTQRPITEVLLWDFSQKELKDQGLSFSSRVRLSP